MKKNKMMRMASVLLVLVLLTTSVVSGTFAKYTTSASSYDIARVAKFDVALTANGTTFANTYAKDDSTFTVDSNTVVSSTSDKVVAPGTTRDMVKMGLTGTPEVATRVSYEGSFDVSNNWVIGPDFYCPLIIKVNTTTINGKDYTSKADFVAAVNNAIKAVKKDYAANTDLSTVGADALAISWEWPFSTSDENDAKDTALGNAGNATVSVTVKTTVTQID